MGGRDGAARLVPRHSARTDTAPPSADATPPPQQGDLFAQAAGLPPTVASQMPERDVARIRAELHATLASITGVEEHPWRDGAGLLLAERRFFGILHWLQPEEAKQPADRFNTEIDRCFASDDPDGADG